MLRKLSIIGALVSIALPLAAQNGARNGEWRSYAADPGSTKYSPLDQINRDNAKNLRIAWRFRTDNLGPRPDFNMGSPTARNLPAAETLDQKCSGGKLSQPKTPSSVIEQR